MVIVVAKIVIAFNKLLIRDNMIADFTGTMIAIYFKEN